MPAATFKDTDKGWRQAFRRLMGARRPVTLRIGILESVPHPTAGMTIDELGAIHEFGLGVPPRSFIADWADERESEHKNYLRKIAQSVSKGRYDVETGLQRLGAVLVGDCQKRIAEGIDPPLDEEYAKRKGSSIPLIDTGALRSALTFDVKQ